MREIKFRAWNGKEMDMHAHNRAWFGPLSSKGDEREGIVMQYTGLKDKNGVEIYEGDIVEDVSAVKKQAYEIAFGTHETCHGDYYSSTAHGFYMKRDGAFIPEHSLPYYEDIEVIGNIYENEDLLTNN